MIYFFIYLFLEVMISSTISGVIGGLNTFIEILISAILGIFILRNFQFSFMESISKARTGEITQEEFIKANVGKAFGAILLIVPGFFTDMLGVLLQFSFLVILFSKVYKFKKSTNQGSYSTNFHYTTGNFSNNSNYNTNNKNYKRNNDEIIDVEIIDDSKSLKH